MDTQTYWNRATSQYRVSMSLLEDELRRSTEVDRQGFSQVADAVLSSAGLAAGRQERAVQEASAAVVTEIASLSSAVAQMSADIVRELVRNREVMTGLLDAVRHPVGTEARERLRMGVNALQNGWTDDAIRELELCIDLDRYIAIAHLYLGMALSQVPQTGRAMTEYRQAVKYGVDEPEIAARAALLYLSSAAGDRGGQAEARDLFGELDGRLGTCPELQVARAKLLGDTSPLVGALTRAPELALPAAADSVPGVSEACTALLDDPHGIGARAIALNRAIARFDTEARHLGVEWPHPELSAPLPAAGDQPALMALAATYLRNAPDVDRAADEGLELLRRQDASIRYAIDRARAEEHAQAARVKDAEASLEGAEANRGRRAKIRARTALIWGIFAALVLLGMIDVLVNDRHSGVGPFTVIAGLYFWPAVYVTYRVRRGRPQGDDRDVAEAARRLEQERERLGQMPAPPEPVALERITGIRQEIGSLCAKLDAVHRDRIVPW